VVALGDNVALAQQKAYKAVNQVQFKDVYYRTDIGYRAVSRGV
jgi:phosphoribosylamine--glycine ligase